MTVLVTSQTAEVIETGALEGKLECILVAEEILNGIDAILLGGANGNTILVLNLQHLQTDDGVELIGRETRTIDVIVDIVVGSITGTVHVNTIVVEGISKT